MTTTPETTDEAAARALYEADVRARPTYGNGEPRPAWDQLPDFPFKWSWFVPRTSPAAQSLTPWHRVRAGSGAP